MHRPLKLIFSLVFSFEWPNSSITPSRDAVGLKKTQKAQKLQRYIFLSVQTTAKGLVSLSGFDSLGLWKV